MILSGAVSVIGSFPHSPKENFEDFVRRCLVVQQRAGVDYPAAQGYRGDMVLEFLGSPSIYGFQRVGETTQFEMTCDEPKLTGPIGIDNFDALKRISAEMGYHPRGFLSPITGPFTLAERVVFSDTSLFELDRSDREKLIWGIARLIGDIVTQYDRYSGNIVGIDDLLRNQEGSTDLNMDT